jgi:hypothetical protein
MDDLVLKRLYAAAPGRDARQKIDTFCKGGAVYHQYYAESVKDRLSDLEKEERDAAVIKSHHEVHEKYKQVIAAQKDVIRELQEGHKNAGQVYKGIFQQARARVDSYQIREKVYEKYINGRLDHVDKMEELMFDRMQLMERKSFALACDTVAKGVVQEATEWIKRSKKRKLKQGGDRRSAKCMRPSSHGRK